MLFALVNRSVNVICNVPNSATIVVHDNVISSLHQLVIVLGYLQQSLTVLMLFVEVNNSANVVCKSP
jgi:hypothetical protein